MRAVALGSRLPWLGQYDGQPVGHPPSLSAQLQLLQSIDSLAS